MEARPRSGPAGSLGRKARNATIVRTTRPESSEAKPKRRVELVREQAELKKNLQVIDAALAHAEPPKVILPELHDRATGRIDARKVAEFMGVPLKRLAEGLGLDYKAVHRNPPAVGFQEALQPVKRTLEHLQRFFQKPEIIRAWLNTPHPMLGGKTSLGLILEGKAFATERLLGNAWEGVWS